MVSIPFAIITTILYYVNPTKFLYEYQFFYPHIREQRFY